MIADSSACRTRVKKVVVVSELVIRNLPLDLFSLFLFSDHICERRRIPVYPSVGSLYGGEKETFRWSLVGDSPEV